MLNQLHQVFGKMLYLSIDILAIDSTSVVKQCQNWGELRLVGTPWRLEDHTYQCDGISVSHSVCLWGCGGDQEASMYVGKYDIFP